MTQLAKTERVIHTLHVMDATGDTRMTWDADVADEVDAARQLFNTMKGKGYLAYAVTAKGEKGEVIGDFDEEAEAIIMSPQLVGG